MENKAINNSFSSNGHSLQLRSKEVSEVMGNVPGWIGSWGGLLMCLFFIISILFFINIKAVQRISGKANIGWRETVDFDKPEKRYFLQVAVSNTEAGKIKKGQQVVFSVVEKNNSLYKMNGTAFSVNDVIVNTDSCVLKFALNDKVLEKIKFNKRITNPGMDCRLETNIAVYKKMFGSVFND